MLSLVHPATQGQGTRPSARRFLAPKLMTAQQTRVRAVLRNLRAAYGSWSCVSEVTGIAGSSLSSTASNPQRASLGFVHRLARAAGMTIEAVLSPGLVVVDVCPSCGRRGAL
jgi:hypothetical protein